MIDRWNSIAEMMRSITTAALKLSLVLVSLALLAGDLPSALGLMLGTALSLWQFFSLAGTLQRALQLGREQAQVHAARRYVVRYLFVAAALVTVDFLEGFNFVATILGLFSVKLVIIGYAVRSVIEEGGVSHLRRLASGKVRREECN